MGLDRSVVLAQMSLKVCSKEGLRDRVEKSVPPDQGFWSDCAILLQNPLSNSVTPRLANGSEAGEPAPREYFKCHQRRLY